MSNVNDAKTVRLKLVDLFTPQLRLCVVYWLLLLLGVLLCTA